MLWYGIVAWHSKVSMNTSSILCAATSNAFSRYSNTVAELGQVDRAKALDSAAKQSRSTRVLASGYGSIRSSVREW